MARRRQNAERVIVVEEPEEEMRTETLGGQIKSIVEPFASGFVPIVAAGATTLAIVQGAPKLGIREEHLACGAAALGFFVAMKTTGVAHETAIAVAAAGASVAVVRFVTGQQLKAALAAQPKRNADAEAQAVREELRTEIARLDGVLLQLAQGLAAQMQQQQERDKQQHERDTMMSEAIRELAMALKRNRAAEQLRDAAPNEGFYPTASDAVLVDEETVSLDEEAAPLGEDTVTEVLEQSSTLQPTTPIDQSTVAVEDKQSPASTEQEVELPPLAPAVLARLQEIRNRLTSEEVTRLNAILSSIPAETLRMALDYIVVIPSADQAVAYIRSAVLQRGVA